MDPRSPLAKHQIRRLNQIRSLGDVTDDSIAAYLRQIDEPCDRSRITNYRNGTRSAPLGLLDLILNHCGDPAAVLNIYAEEHGLRVVPDGDLDTDNRSLADRALDIASLSGQVVNAVRAALAGGKVSEQERESVRSTAAELRRVAAELETWARRSAA